MIKVVCDICEKETETKTLLPTNQLRFNETAWIIDVCDACCSNLQIHNKQQFLNIIKGTQCYGSKDLS
jgi:hypothetical protein